MKDTISNTANRVFSLSHAFDDERKNPVLSVNDWKAGEDFQIENLYAGAIECANIMRRVCVMNRERRLFAFPKIHDAVTMTASRDGVSLSALAASVQETAKAYETAWTDESAKPLLAACADWLELALYESDIMTDWDILKAIHGENPVRDLCKSLESLFGVMSYSGKTEI